MRDVKTNIRIKRLCFSDHGLYNGPLSEEFLPGYFSRGVFLKRSDLCFDLLTLFEYLLRIKIKKDRK